MFIQKRKALLSLAAFLVISTVILSGCSTGASPAPGPGSTDTSGNTSQPAPAAPPSSGATIPPVQSEHPVKLTLYFPNKDATGVVPVERVVNIPDQAVIKAMFQELANPPDGIYSPLPKGTKLLGATVKDGIATVDLSKEFQTNHPGGTAGEAMTLYGIVNTLTTLPNVKGVQFLLEGEKQVAILGHAETSNPIMRNEGMIQKGQ